MNKVKRIDEYYTTKNNVDWEKIIDDFTPYVKTIINNMAGDNLEFEDKEEILSDVFFVLWKNKRNIISSLDAYIAGVTRNLIKEKFRKKKITYDIADYENTLTYATYDMCVNERKEVIKIEKELKKLKPIDSQIMTMYYYSSMSMKDIAKKLNISEFNVATKLYRIRKKIKKDLR